MEETRMCQRSGKVVILLFQALENVLACLQLQQDLLKGQVILASTRLKWQID